MPRQSASVEVHQNVAERLHVVSTRLLDAQVCVDACVAGRPSQVFVFPVWNVGPRPVVSELLGQTKVDQKEFVAVTPDAHEEVVGLDVSVDEVFVVNKLDAAYHLVGKHQHRLHGEPSGAKVKEIFEGGTQKVHDEDVVVALGAVPPDVRNPDAALKDLVQLGLVQKLRVTSLTGLELKKKRTQLFKKKPSPRWSLSVTKVQTTRTKCAP